MIKKNIVYLKQFLMNFNFKQTCFIINVFISLINKVVYTTRLGKIFFNANNNRIRGRRVCWLMNMYYDKR